MSEKSKDGVDTPPPPYDQAMAPGVGMAPQSAALPFPGYVVVHQQPGVIYVQAMPIPAHEAPDHLIMAILATVLCCLPLGIVAIVKAAECKVQRATGNRELAIVNSRSARKWALWAICIGTVSIIVYAVFYFLYIRQLQMHLED